jgi:hypothetical protein
MNLRFVIIVLGFFITIVLLTEIWFMLKVTHEIVWEIKEKTNET